MYLQVYCGENSLFQTYRYPDEVWIMEILHYITLVNCQFQGHNFDKSFIREGRYRQSTKPYYLYLVATPVDDGTILL